jgi:hypothetical protein
MAAKSSLPSSQEPEKTDEFSAHPPTLDLEDPF